MGLGIASQNGILFIRLERKGTQLIMKVKILHTYNLAYTQSSTLAVLHTGNLAYKQYFIKAILHTSNLAYSQSRTKFTFSLVKSQTNMVDRVVN